MELTMHAQAYLPRYDQSWALVVGIDRYASVGPLQHAANDARGVATALIDRFGFPQANVTLLCDLEATRVSILAGLLRFAEKTGPDDRVVFFFAGHGDTRVGRRGDVGYLVPQDGDPGLLATLIRWDEITRNADLIPAKHMLFLMDACYGGLALVRAAPAGSMRFVKDMLCRYSRQVLTAGKPDEPVADGGGPRPNHSMFTAHLLEALGGRAAGPDGILTAANVTAYVYERVAKDHASVQSPHYGHLDGDGDFVFNPPALAAPAAPDAPDASPEDVLVQVPPIGASRVVDDDFRRTCKQYLSEPKHRIDLDDMLTSELKDFLYTTREELFSVNAPRITAESVAVRLKAYETAMDRLFTLSALITKWGDPSHRPLLSRALARLTDNNELRGGTTGWLALRWYPVVRLLYGITISAIAGNQYENLRAALTAAVGNHVGDNARFLLNTAIDELYRALDMFKVLPDHERAFVPLSEYLFKNLQAPLEDLHFLGRSYEETFDTAEILLALSYAELDEGGPAKSWRPPGRFNWKHKRRHLHSPLLKFLTDATAMHDRWAPLRAGFFGGSPERFEEHRVGIEKWADGFRAF